MVKGSRAVLVLAALGLVLAWLAAAADRQAAAPRAAADHAPAAHARAEHLAQDIRDQERRLRSQLDSAPQPTMSGRNPFTFDDRTPGGSRSAPLQVASVAPALEAVMAAATPDPPLLTLSGIAEDPAGADNPALPRRVAVLSGYGDVFLARIGETIASRYEVTAIGADAVELKDLITGTTIRLGLR